MRPSCHGSVAMTDLGFRNRSLTMVIPIETLFNVGELQFTRPLGRLAVGKYEASLDRNICRMSGPGERRRSRPGCKSRISTVRNRLTQS